MYTVAVRFMSIITWVCMAGFLPLLWAGLVDTILDPTLHMQLLSNLPHAVSILTLYEHDKNFHFGDDL